MKEAAAPRLLSAGIGGNVLSLLGMLLTVIGVLVLAYWVTRLIGRHGMPGLAKASGGRGRLEVQSPGASADTPSFLDILRDNFPKKK